MVDQGRARPETFHWSDMAERVAALRSETTLVLDAERRELLGAGVSVHLPPLIPLPPGLAPAPETETMPERAARLRAAESLGSADSIDTYLASLPAVLPRHVLLLMQAGAVSMGVFEGGTALVTKSFKRYVVRGNGRAQPSHLASKGKSRYGSRLRLQNARELLEDTNAKLSTWWDEHGAPETLFISAPRRLMPDLFRARVSPPFSPDDPFVRVPLDVPVPTTEVLLRTYKALGYGRIARSTTG